MEEQSSGYIPLTRNFPRLHLQLRQQLRSYEVLLPLLQFSLNIQASDGVGSPQFETTFRRNSLFHRSESYVLISRILSFAEQVVCTQRHAILLRSSWLDFQDLM